MASGTFPPICDEAFHAGLKYRLYSCLCFCASLLWPVGASFDPGDHAFVSYGPVSNDDLLQYYGFVERDNPSDAYVLEDMGKWLREVCLLCVHATVIMSGSCFVRYCCT